MSTPAKESVSRAAWTEIVKRYHDPDARIAVWQLATTMPPFFVLLFLAYRSLQVSYLLTLVLAVPTAGLLVRIFVIQHDCGHGAFLPWKTANDAVGKFCSLLTWTPYHAWRHDHAVHHATAGNLDHRGTGDIRTLTLEEYRALPFWRRVHYRIYRHPLLLLVIGPVLHFVIAQRLTIGMNAEKRRERMSVRYTNLALALEVWALSATVGLPALVLVGLPIITVAASAGVWLFYVQHQFDEAYWVHEEHWDYVAVALQGSSFYKLPRVLQWFTANIGFHHVHHLSPRIPNYLLERCHRENPIFHQAKVMTLLSSLKTIPLVLYDEAQRRLISFREAHRRLVTVSN